MIEIYDRGNSNHAIEEILTKYKKKHTILEVSLQGGVQFPTGGI